MKRILFLFLICLLSSGVAFSQTNDPTPNPSTPAKSRKPGHRSHPNPPRSDRGEATKTFFYITGKKSDTSQKVSILDILDLNVAGYRDKRNSFLGSTLGEKKETDWENNRNENLKSNIFNFDIGPQNVLKGTINYQDRRVKLDGNYFVFQVFIKQAGSPPQAPSTTQTESNPQSAAVSWVQVELENEFVMAMKPCTVLNGSVTNVRPRVWYLEPSAFDGDKFFDGEKDPVLIFNEDEDSHYEVNGYDKLDKAVFSIDLQRLILMVKSTTASGAVTVTPTAYSAQDGDQIEIRAYSLKKPRIPKADPDQKDTDFCDNFNTVPDLDSVIHLDIHKFQTNLKTAPFFLYGTIAGATNSSWNDFNLIDAKPIQPGVEFYIDYEGTDIPEDILINRLTPGVNISFISPYAFRTASNGNPELDMALGLTWRLPLKYLPPFICFLGDPGVVDACDTISDNLEFYMGRVFSPSLGKTDETLILGLTIAPAAFQITTLPTRNVTSEGNPPSPSVTSSSGGSGK